MTMIKSRRAAADGLLSLLVLLRSILLPCVVLWCSVLLPCVQSPPVDGNNPAQGLFPQQQPENPFMLHDGNSIQDKLFIMKMMYLLERGTTARHGLSQTTSWRPQYVFEGDIILEKDQALELIYHKRKRRRKRKMDTQVTLPAGTKKWRLPIHYQFDGKHSGAEQAIILDGIKHWENQTCINFTSHNNTKEKRIKFIKDSACYSYVGSGKNITEQIVSIGVNCLGIGIIAHEIGHSLGFWHEHARADRDDYLNIFWHDIIIGQGHNFEKKTWQDIDNMAVPYDLGSVMHYSGETYSKASELTIQSKDSFLQNTMGQRQELSFYDVKLANIVYCKDICKRNQLQYNCSHDGYQDPLNCSTCRCADGLAGDTCEAVAPSNDECGGTITLTRDSLVTISSPGYPLRYKKGIRCYWLIKSPNGTDINMQFKEPFMNGSFCDLYRPYQACQDFVEIRFKVNLGQTGGRFCCNDYVQNRTLHHPIVSHSNQALILFKSFMAGGVGFRMELSIKSCGGCHNNVTEYQVSCLRTEVNKCYQTWYVKRKRPGCVFVGWGCSYGYELQLVKRKSLCYTEKASCCHGYILSDDKKTCSKYVGTTEAPQPVDRGVTEGSLDDQNTTDNNTDVAQDEGYPNTWSVWGAWGQCSRSCGGCGLQTRSRSCPEGQTCSGEEDEQEQSCNSNPCHSGMAMQFCAHKRNVTETCLFSLGPCYREVTTYRSSPSSCCCGYDLQNQICVLDTS